MIARGWGWVVLRVGGDGAAAAFRHEPGGHRYQRIPPTERRGRVHTSTVTVAVMSPNGGSGLSPIGDTLDRGEVDVRYCRGSGKGGQNRNKRETAVVATHRPTGVSVRIENERRRERNEAEALRVLAGRVKARLSADRARARDAERKGQVGSGMRGDKVRTIRFQDETVTDHRLGRRWRLGPYMRGEDGPWA